MTILMTIILMKPLAAMRRMTYCADERDDDIDDDDSGDEGVKK